MIHSYSYEITVEQRLWFGGTQVLAVHCEVFAEVVHAN